MDTGREREREEREQVRGKLLQAHGTNLRVLLVVVKSFADEKLPVAEAEL